MHRLGQKRSVLVIRLVAEHTVDQVVLSRAMQKLKLSHVAIEQGGFGAHVLFSCSP